MVEGKGGNGKLAKTKADMQQTERHPLSGQTWNKTCSSVNVFHFKPGLDKVPKDSFHFGYRNICILYMYIYAYFSLLYMY